MYLQHWYGWCHMKLLLSLRILNTPYNHAPFHLMQSHICKVHACLAVPCHLHVWQNDRDLLHAAAVTRGCNRYWNKSQHRKLTLKKKILPPFLQGLEPMTFQSWVWCFNRWPILTPHWLTAFDIVHIALFSAANQVHCNLVTYDSKWVTVALH